MSARPRFQWAADGQDRRVARVWVDAALECFAGHFPGNPILPGIVQIDWALDACEDQWRMKDAFVRMSRVKFKKPVAPATWLELAMEREAAADSVSVKFSFRDGEQVATEGVLHFRA